jgi:hypothetical protein
MTKMDSSSVDNSSPANSNLNKEDEGRFSNKTRRLRQERLNEIN